MNSQSPDFDSIRKLSPYEAEYWSARELAPLLGYTRWENFAGVVQRARNLIGTGAKSGRITEAMKTVTLGKGGRMQILDYHLDPDAALLVRELASSYKLNKFYAIRNETVLLTLLAKYCRLKGYSFEFQYNVDGFVYDCLVAGCIVVEFDEPHHARQRARRNDADKQIAAASRGLTLVRFDLSSDVVDMIVEIEQRLALGTDKQAASSI